MVARTAFINKLHQLNYYYKGRQKRTELYRKKGGTHRMFIPLNSNLEDETVMHLLRQAGCTDEEIRKFVAAAR